MAKIICTNPLHQDTTPSMHVYPDSAYCFVCGHTDKNATDKEAPKREPEDIQQTMEYINSLPRRRHRGLEFPTDSFGFYVVYPDSSYYKKRLFQGNIRYVGPRGHKSPLFVYPGSGSALVLVEGEINTISLKHSLSDCPWTIASPGSASEFSKAIDFSREYAIVITVVDKDPAGVAAGLSFKKELLKCQKEVRLIALEKDFNDILQETGPEGVKQTFKQALGL